jgi:hypothetical protein
MQFLRRQSVVPFETALAAICVYSGIAGFLQFGLVNNIFSKMLGVVLANVFNSAYIASGAAMFMGVGLNRRNLEAFGVIMLAMSLVVRSVVVHHNVGFSPDVLNNYAFAAAFIVACAVRLWSLAKKQTLIETTEVVKLISA